MKDRLLPHGHYFRWCCLLVTKHLSVARVVWSRSVTTTHYTCGRSTTPPWRRPRASRWRASEYSCCHRVFYKNSHTSFIMHCRSLLSICCSKQQFYFDTLLLIKEYILYVLIGRDVLSRTLDFVEPKCL